MTAQPAGLAAQLSRKPGKEEFLRHAIAQAQARRVGIQGRREGMPPRKDLVNSAGTGNPRSGAQRLELNSGERLERFASVTSALLRAQVGFKFAATVRMLLRLLAGAELIQVSLPS